jgi:endonuclease/exonuclease/phosphatase family metal-dependent hydrolase
MPWTIRAATYNLYLGADITVIFGVSSQEDLAGKAGVVRDQVLATDFAGRAAAIARILVRERVDVVGLQEVSRWSRTVTDADGEQRTEVWLDFLEALLVALAAEGAEYDVHACTANFRGGATIPGEGETSVLGHNVVLVRRGSGVRVTGERVGDFSRTLDIPTGMPELVLNVARSWGGVDVEVQGRPIRFVNTHLEAWDEAVRTAQREELLEVMDDFAGPVVVVGDFNATPEAVGMPPEYSDAWAVAGDGAGLTSGQAADLLGPSALATRIDYIWVRGVEVAACRVVGERPEDRTSSGLWPSDHACVVADIVV